MRVEAPAIVAGQIFLGTQVGPGSGHDRGVVHTDQQDGRDGAGQDRRLQTQREAVGRFPVREHAAGQRPGRLRRAVDGHLPRRAERGAVEGTVLDRAT